jgi:hypothetical protein
VKETDQNTNPDNPTIDELLLGMNPGGRYAHLQLILSKNDNRKPGQSYLMVTTTGFSLVKIIDLSFQDNVIQLTLMDSFEGIVNRFQIDLNDKSFHFLLIPWQDILDIHRETQVNWISESPLLDFEF